MLRKKILILYCALLLVGRSYTQISGFVVNEAREELSGAYIQLLPDSLQTVGDDQGRFQFSGLKNGQYRLEVSYLGYESSSIPIRIQEGKSQPIKIVLEHDHQLLHTVEVIEEHAKQEESLSVDHFNEQFITENLQGSFAKSIEKLPGISAINVGVGIAKPVIRGLSSNRIIVNHQGIKQEGQQWASDHGLEIDQFDIERVEIVKGPASLQYGSDGLGGVINIMPGRMLPKNTVVGNILSVYKSNNEHWGGSARLGLNINDVFVNARYSRQSFGDYRVPATTFTYNDFTLPIENNSLKNTAGQEENLSISAGINRKWGITRLLFSQYSLEAGLFSGAVGIPRSYALTDDGNRRDIDVPKQAVTHYRASINQTFLFGEDHFVIDAGFQRNLRREFSFPEFHSIPSSLIDPNDNLALAFDLDTYSLAAHYEDHLSHAFKSVYGVNVQWQQNRRSGFEFLLPDFRTFRSGVFSLIERELSEKLLVNGGIRFDYARNETDFFSQNVWNSNEVVIDSLVAPFSDTEFYNWSASVGANWTLGDGQYTIKANAGKSFRVPYPAETVSNGIHHGTFRHEVGTPDLASEHGYQLDASLDWKGARISGGIALYFNYFDNYIYLGPTFPAQFSPLPEAGQIFRYRQDDAIYTGGELQWTWMILPKLELNQAADFVQSYNPKTQLALPFTPQPAVRTDLRWDISNNFLEDAHVELNHQYHFAASGAARIDRSERPTPAYQLWGISLGAELQIGKQHIQLNAQVQNIFDTFYLAHLSRYRLLNIPEQGRNIVVSISVPFTGKILQKQSL